ncbi:MAG: single-stranded-DNA-specific exonuclease RecJ [Chromatiales bacterium]|nr:single-stranded-DNA-specific exonuclease RecJ [Chromatiales bacterium]
MARSIRRLDSDPQVLAALPQHLHPVVRQVLANRGVPASETEPRLGALLPVSSLNGTLEAAQRLLQARESGERLVVLGDFDADGATATALLVRCLRRFGFSRVEFIVPDRFRFGYGLSPAIAEVAARGGPGLMVTVDNGITSVSGCARAAELGLEVIITDHHLAAEALPPASCIINPNLPSAPFASTALCGVGVAFYLAAVLGRLLAEAGLVADAEVRQALSGCLDLVALGTVADMVPLDFNNRILVAEGLRRIRAGQLSPGLAALFSVAGRDPLRAQASDLGFAIAPRLNAAGRLEDMREGISCLLCDDPAEAARLAARLDGLNAERRELQARMVDEARALLDGSRDDCQSSQAALCLFDARWHQGIVGLVATRMREQTGRPVVAFAPDSDPQLLRGSARSVPGLNIRDALAAAVRRLPDPELRFGGHAMAAGISLPASQLERFSELLNEEVARMLDPARDPGVLWSDGALAPEDLGLGLAGALEQAGPWGQGFPEPLFDNRFRLLDQRVVGGDHLRLALAHEQGGDALEAIAFNHPPLPQDAAALHCAYRLEINWFRGRGRPQLVVEHIECD